MLDASDFFDLTHSAHAALFQGTTYVWEGIGRIAAYVQARLSADLTPNAHNHDLHPLVALGSQPVYIGQNVNIEPTAYIEGPALIMDGAKIGHGAHIRANVVIGAGAMVGHATEVKNSLLLAGAAAPHFSYIGDSLLGRHVNLGAGTKISNLPVNSVPDPVTHQRPTIVLTIEGQRYDTGLAKFGAILGDEAQTGCNTVTNPGVLIGPRTLTYPLMSLSKGYYPPDHIIKLRQQQEIVQIVQRA